MSEKSSYKLTQDYDVLLPKTGKAYPILCEEWNYLKKNIDLISDKSNIHYIIGSVLIGSCITTLVTIFTGNFPNHEKLIFAWSVVFITLIIGVYSFFTGYSHQKVTKKKASDIVDQMELIEKRYKAETKLISYSKEKIRKVQKDSKHTW